MSTPVTNHPNTDSQQAGHTINTDNIKPDPDYLRQTQSATFPQSTTYPSFYQNPSPFTTSLPPESQQMLAYAPQFDINDPTYAMLMQGSDQYTSSSYYPWHDMNQSGLKGMPVHPSAYQGMSATLAPSDLEHHAMNSGASAQDDKTSSLLNQDAQPNSTLTHSSALPPQQVLTLTSVKSQRDSILVAWECLGKIVCRATSRLRAWPPVRSLRLETAFGTTL